MKAGRSPHKGGGLQGWKTEAVEGRPWKGWSMPPQRLDGRLPLEGQRLEDGGGWKGGPWKGWNMWSGLSKVVGEASKGSACWKTEALREGWKGGPERLEHVEWPPRPRGMEDGGGPKGWRRSPKRLDGWPAWLEGQRLDGRPAAWLDEGWKTEAAQ